MAQSQNLLQLQKFIHNHRTRQRRNEAREFIADDYVDLPEYDLNDGYEYKYDDSETILNLESTSPKILNDQDATFSFLKEPKHAMTEDDDKITPGGLSDAAENAEVESNVINPTQAAPKDGSLSVDDDNQVEDDNKIINKEENSEKDTNQPENSKNQSADSSIYIGSSRDPSFGTGKAVAASGEKISEDESKNVKVATGVLVADSNLSSNEQKANNKKEEPKKDSKSSKQAKPKTEAELAAEKEEQRLRDKRRRECIENKKGIIEKLPKSGGVPVITCDDQIDTGGFLTVQNVVIFIFLILLCCCCLRCYKRKKKKRASREHDPEGTPLNQGDRNPNFTPNKTASTKPGLGSIQEQSESGKTTSVSHSTSTYSRTQVISKSNTTEINMSSNRQNRQAESDDFNQVSTLYQTPDDTKLGVKANKTVVIKDKDANSDSSKEKDVKVRKNRPESVADRIAREQKERLEKLKKESEKESTGLIIPVAQGRSRNTSGQSGVKETEISIIAADVTVARKNSARSSSSSSSSSSLSNVTDPKNNPKPLDPKVGLPVAPEVPSESNLDKEMRQEFALDNLISTLEENSDNEQVFTADQERSSESATLTPATTISNKNAINPSNAIPAFSQRQDSDGSPKSNNSDGNQNQIECPYPNNVNNGPNFPVVAGELAPQTIYQEQTIIIERKEEVHIHTHVTNNIINNEDHQSNQESNDTNSNTITNNDYHSAKEDPDTNQEVEHEENEQVDSKIDQTRQSNTDTTPGVSNSSGKNTTTASDEGIQTEAALLDQQKIQKILNNSNSQEENGNSNDDMNNNQDAESFDDTDITDPGRMPYRTTG